MDFVNFFFAIRKQWQHNINICGKLKFKCSVHAAVGFVDCVLSIKVLCGFKGEISSSVQRAFNEN